MTTELKCQVCGMFCFGEFCSDQCELKAKESKDDDKEESKVETIFEGDILEVFRCGQCVTFSLPQGAINFYDDEMLDAFMNDLADLIHQATCNCEDCHKENEEEKGN